MPRIQRNQLKAPLQDRLMLEAMRRQGRGERTPAGFVARRQKSSPSC